MAGIELHWELTNLCNLNCLHCITSGGEAESGSFNLSQAKEVVLRLKKENVTSICFTGGEPFCFDGLLELVEYVLDNGIRPQIITNGTLVTMKDLQFFKDNNIHIGISLESADRLINDEIRGIGSYDKTIKTICSASSSGCPFSLYYTINSKNHNDVIDMLRFGLDSGCVGVHFNDLTYGGRVRENEQLMLSEQQRYSSLLEIERCSKELLGLGFQKPESTCWADSTSFLMGCNGDIFLCTEIKKLNKRNRLGNIFSFDFQRWIKDNASLEYTTSECCYHAYFNDYITYTRDILIPCVLTESFNSSINDIFSLKQNFDALYKKYKLDCTGCEYPDCVGYLWLLESEANDLLKRGVDIVVINELIHFLWTFKTADGEVDIEMFRPKCEFRGQESRKCTIRDYRPLVCHMYPISPETTNGSFVWGLHKDCQFTVRLLADKPKLHMFLNDVRNIVSFVSAELSKELYQMYNQLDDLTNFPGQEKNEYIVVCEMHN